jgi:hypothetical protein
MGRGTGATQAQAVGPARRGEAGYAITSVIDTEDGQMEFQGVDVTSWFEKASDEAILDIAERGWGSGSLWETHDVAESVSDVDDGAAQAFAHARANDVNVSCAIDAGEALAWLRRHRPTLATQVAALTATAA